MFFKSKKAFQREVEAEAEKRETEAQRREREWKERQRKLEEEYRERVRICDQIAREQLRQAKELAQHEALLAKHDEQIAKLEYRMDQAEADIAHWEQALQDLNDLFDRLNERALQYRAGGNTEKEDATMRKIIALRNQIHTAESKIRKARHEQEQAQIKLGA